MICLYTAFLFSDVLEDALFSAIRSLPQDYKEYGYFIQQFGVSDRFIADSKHKHC